MSGGNHVYVMNVTGSDIYKIGITNNPETRRRALQTANSSRLSIWGSWEFSNRKLCETLESQLHYELDANRCMGEWFRLSDANTRHVISVLDAAIFLHEMN